MGLVEKPVLDEQQLERLDALVKEAVRDQFTVKLVYYENKRLLNLKGKLRVERNNLYLDARYLMIDNIIDITLI
ncbi:MAG: YolD-like family protein, partial [Halanaerobiales bacterium]|nr:YolD-like family protein [Halanaerobiales bacterium]